MENSPSKSASADRNEVSLDGQRHYRAEIARTLLDNATEQSTHRDSLTAYVLSEANGAIQSQLQHAIARAGVEWPSIDETVVVTQRTSDTQSAIITEAESAWFYLCFRNDQLFALLTPLQGSAPESRNTQPAFECALLEPSTKSRNNQPGEVRYIGTSVSNAGDASWRVTLSNEGFRLRLSRVSNSRRAIVTTIDAVTDDALQRDSKQSLRPRFANLFRRLSDWLSERCSASDQSYVSTARVMVATDNVI